MPLFRFIVLFALISITFGCGDRHETSDAKLINSDTNSFQSTTIDYLNLSITNKNFWHYNNEVNELLSQKNYREAAILSKRIQDGNISRRNRLDFYLSYFDVLMHNEQPDSALKILRIRYISNPLDDLSINENLYFYYFWGSILKLQTSECDSAKYFYNKLVSLNIKTKKLTSDTSNVEVLKLHRIIQESCE